MGVSSRPKINQANVPAQSAPIPSNAVPARAAVGEAPAHNSHTPPGRQQQSPPNASPRRLPIDRRMN